MKLFSKLAIKLLGIDDTEFPTEQVGYIRDVSKEYSVPEITKNTFGEFVDSLLHKHLIDGVVVFKENTLLYSSSPDLLELANKLYEMFTGFKRENKVLYFNVGSWVSMFEKNAFVYMVKSETRLSEFELNAVAKDIAVHGKNIFLEEYRKIMSFVKV